MKLPPLYPLARRRTAVTALIGAPFFLYLMIKGGERA